MFERVTAALRPLSKRLSTALMRPAECTTGSKPHSWYIADAGDDGVKTICKSCRMVRQLQKGEQL
jgi:hypothetical protein